VSLFLPKVSGLGAMPALLKNSGENVGVGRELKIVWLQNVHVNSMEVSDDFRVYKFNRR
jgi:hypothetical protein